MRLSLQTSMQKLLLLLGKQKTALQFLQQGCSKDLQKDLQPITVLQHSLLLCKGMGPLQALWLQTRLSQLKGHYMAD